MTDLTKSLEEMEGIADQATPGDWEAWQEMAPHGPWFVELSDGSHLPIGHTADGEPDEANARHIATFDPTTVKALLRVAKAADGAEDALATLIESVADEHGGDETKHPYWPVLQEIRAALEALHTEGDNDE